MIGKRSINTEVPALGDSLSWDTNQCVCDITSSDGRSYMLDVILIHVHFYQIAVLRAKSEKPVASMRAILVKVFKKFNNGGQ